MTNFYIKMLVAGIFMIFLIPALAKAPLLSAEDLTSPPPRIIRTCCSFGVDLGYAIIPLAKRTDITSVQNLGPHHYLGDNSENNGIIYTKRGGFIDLGHLRDCADWTAFLYTLIQSKRYCESETLTILGKEGGQKSLVLEIPSELDSVKTSEVAGKIAYELSLWHEIATWFGVSYIPLIPERYSSFSPEDLYSNLLGVELGIQALKSNLEYNEAMTQLISNMFDSLEAVNTVEETYLAMEKVENIWWTREKSLPSKKILLERYVDSDLFLVPWLVPTMESSKPLNKLSKPNNSLSDLYAIKIKLNHKFPLNAILPNHKNRFITQNDFGQFMKYINEKILALNQKTAKQAERKKNRKNSRAESRS